MNKNLQNSEKPLSALEKAKLLIKEKENKRKEEENKALENKQKEEESVTASYGDITKKINDLENQKKEIEDSLVGIKTKRKENIKDQRASIKELTSSEDGKEGLKNADTKKEIFSDSEENLEEIKIEQKNKKNELKEINDEIEKTKQEAEKLYEQTPEYKQKEQEKLDEAKKIEQKEIAKELNFNFNFKLGTLDVSNIENVVKKYGLEKIKEVFEKNINNQIKHVLDQDISNQGLDKAKEQIEKYKEDKERYELYSTQYPKMLTSLRDKFIELRKVVKELDKSASNNSNKTMDFLLYDESVVDYKLEQIENEENYSRIMQEHRSGGSNYHYFELDSMKEVIKSIDSVIEKSNKVMKSPESYKDFLEDLKNQKKSDNKSKLKEIYISQPQASVIITNIERQESKLSVDAAQQLVDKEEKKIIEKEKLFKDTMGTQFERVLMILERRNKFPDSIIRNLDDQLYLYESKKRDLIDSLSELSKKRIELAPSVDKELVEVVIDKNGNISFPKKVEEYEVLHTKEKALYAEIDNLSKEKLNLENQMRSMGMLDSISGKKKRTEERIKEITIKINGENGGNGLLKEQSDLVSKMRNIQKYPRVELIMEKADLDPKEMMNGVRTLSGLFANIEKGIKEKEAIAFDPEKKKFIDKFKELDTEIERNKYDFKRKIQELSK